MTSKLAIILLKRVVTDGSRDGSYRRVVGVVSPYSILNTAFPSTLWQGLEKAHSLHW